MRAHGNSLDRVPIHSFSSTPHTVRTSLTRASPPPPLPPAVSPSPRRSRPQDPPGSGTRSQNSDGTPGDEIYYFGIIDILQQYTIKKAGESFFKGLFTDRDSISAVDAHKYARRFVDFIDRHTM